MIALLPIGIALPSVAAYLFMDRIVGPAPRAPLELASRVATALLLGLSASALLAFAWLTAGGALGTYSYAIADSIFFCLATIVLFRIPGTVREPARASRTRSVIPFDRISLVVLSIAVGIAAMAVAQELYRNPHGAWDAWAIWNLRARFLARAGQAWRNAFSSEIGWSRPEYPPLLSLIVARLFTFGGETTVIPRLVAGLFTMATPVVLAGAVTRRSGALAGAAAALILLATQSWISVGTLQYADVPVAALLVTGLAFAGNPLHEPIAPGAAVASGFTFGLAGFTKNEGLAGAMFAFLACGLLAWWARGARAAFKETVAMALGAVPPAAAWLFFHASVSPGIAPALTNGQSLPLLVARITDTERWQLILLFSKAMMPGPEFLLPGTALSVAALIGIRARALASPALVVAITLYPAILCIFAATPLPLAWHLSTAMSRLLLHPWPALLLAIFGAVRPRTKDEPVSA